MQTTNQTLADASNLLIALAREERSVNFYKQSGLADPQVTANAMRDLCAELSARGIEWKATVVPSTGAILTVIRFDADWGSESWSWHATVAVAGVLPCQDDAPDSYDVDEIQQALGSILPFRSAGNGGAGQPFADAPWLQFLGNPCRTILVSQRGGLDV